ncbi:hypothetical protein ACIBBE_37615 [Streptomyces sp. NPDC051644]|uniref:hypothetical protein n=1 Tax=Streptomyces sp. NPDC051644 TaxID=3365666 RepID=UPI0037AF7A43
MDRLLRGEIPPAGKRDIKTLTREADVDRTAIYGTRPYAHLRVEFERRLQALQQAGDIPDPREAQITRLKTENAKLRERLDRSEQTIEELTDYRTQALARLAAQHEEIIRLPAAGNLSAAHQPYQGRRWPDAYAGKRPSVASLYRALPGGSRWSLPRP